MEPEEIKKELYLYIQHAAYSHKENIRDTTLLFREGIFDSMGFVSLIAFLEEKFNVITADGDLVEQNFESINAILNFVLNKKRISVTPGRTTST